MYYQTDHTYHGLGDFRLHFPVLHDPRFRLTPVLPQVQVLPMYPVPCREGLVVEVAGIVHPVVEGRPDVRGSRHQCDHLLGELSAHRGPMLIQL